MTFRHPSSTGVRVRGVRVRSHSNRRTRDSQGGHLFVGLFHHHDDRAEHKRNYGNSVHNPLLACRSAFCSWQLLAGAWKASPDGKWWVQVGLERTFQKQKDFSEKQRDRAKSKWCRKDAEVVPDSSRKDAGAMPEGMPKVCSSSSSSSSNHKPGSVMPVACPTDAGCMPDTSAFNSTDVAQILCRENFWSGRLMIEALKSSVEFKSAEMPECSLEQVGEWLATSYATYKAEKGDRAADPLKYFKQAMYPHSTRKPLGATVLANNPATYAMA